MDNWRALDLYCCAGGASLGLAQVGFTMTGVDIKKQKNYPYTFVLGDALSLSVSFLRQFDLIWASPPCQFCTVAGRLALGQGRLPSQINLIPQTRELLLSSGVPYIIENVPKAPLRKDLLLCGSSFGLKVRRHRIFECSFPITVQPDCNHKAQGRSVGVYHSMGDEIPCGGKTAKTLEEGSLAMGIYHMTWKELTQAVPPVYGTFLGNLFLKQRGLSSACYGI